MHSSLSFAGLVLVAIAGAAGPGLSQDAPPAPPGGIAPPSQLTMPFVSPTEGERFMASRIVPPSDVPAMQAGTPAGGLASAATRQAVPAAAAEPGALGHELPTDPAGPSGFPRADFAIAPKASADKDGAGAAATTAAH